MTNKDIYREMGGIDPWLIMDAAPAEKKQNSKSKTWVKWASLAACLCLVVVVGVYTIPNMIGHQSGLSEDEIFERSNTYFDSYEELAAIIGNDTLLENIDFSSLGNYELRLKHELDNVNEYSEVSFADMMPNDTFGFGIYFPSYKDAFPDYCNGEDKITINGIEVEYLNRTEGTSLTYYYMAEFEYNGCFYVIRSYGYTDESVFWEKLHALLGE